MKIPHAVTTVNVFHTIRKFAEPQAMIDTFTRDHDIEVTHGWGMTEMSPVGTLTLFRPEERVPDFKAG